MSAAFSVATPTSLASERPRRDVALTLLVMLAFGAYGVAEGASTGWDLRNYHLYAPYAWLTGRAAIDLVPSQVQGFYNPLLYVPAYLLAANLPTTVSTFAFGALQGLNAPLLVAILRRLRDGAIDDRLAWAVALVASLGATAASEIGSTQGDAWVTIPLLFGVLSILRGRWIVGGVAFGIAAGLKLAIAPIAAGFLVAAPLAIARSAPAAATTHAARPGSSMRGTAGRDALVAWTRLALGLAIGLVATFGPWALELALRYGNPIFPFASSLFPSDYDVGRDLSDPRWRPGSLVDALAYPVRWLFDWRLVLELRFRDLRIPLFYLMLPWLAWRARAKPPLRFLLLAFVLGYAAWCVLFGYYRYLVAWEMLATVVLVVALLDARVRTRYVVALLFVLVTTTNAPDWGRRGHDRHYVDVALPVERDTLLLLAGDRPLAHLALAVPREVPIVRISSNFFGPPAAPTIWDALAGERIARHAGPIALVYQDASPEATDRALAAHRLARGRCSTIDTRFVSAGEPPLVFCTIARR